MKVRNTNWKGKMKWTQKKKKQRKKGKKKNGRMIIVEAAFYLIDK